MTASRVLLDDPAAYPEPIRRVPPPLRVVVESNRPARPAASRARLAVVLGVTVLVVAVFGAVVAHVVLAQDQFRLEQLQRRSVARQAEYDRLRLQVAELESPQRIVATAEQRLGMVVPPGVTYLAPSPDVPSVAPMTDSSSKTSPSSTWATVKSHLAAG